MGRVIQKIVKPNIPAPEAPPPPPSPSNPEVQSAQSKASQDELKKAKSRSATIFTSGEGDTSQASVSKRVLLGA